MRGELDVGSQIELPSPNKNSEKSLEEVIAIRRTIREFSQDPLTIEELATICWAGQGVTSAYGRLRTAPSAGGMHPLFLYIVLGEDSVTGIDVGVYVYMPGKHSLDLIKEGDVRSELAQLSVNQMWMSDAAVLFLIVCEPKRMVSKYGDRSILYSCYEAGAVAENILLEAVSLGLGGATVGAFDDAAIAAEVELKEKERVPLLILPIGHLL